MAGSGAINPPNTALVTQDLRVTPEWYRYFAQRKVQLDAVSLSGFVTVEDQTENYPNSRALAVDLGELTKTDDGASISLGLAETDVSAGTYGSESSLAVLTVDPFGRVTLASEEPLDSDDVTEGAVNLFFTTARARGSVSGGTGIDYSSTTGIIALANTTVSPGTYGDASHVIQLTVDAQGRITSISQIALNSDNITEGSTKLFFTQARARASISGSGQISYNSSTGVISSTGYSGTVSPVTSITVVNGIVTAVS